MSLSSRHLRRMWLARYAQMWQWRGSPAKVQECAHVRLMAAPSRAKRLRANHRRRSRAALAAMRAAASGSGGGGGLRGSRRRSGAWRSAMRPTACQPKKRLTRSQDDRRRDAGFRSPPGLRPATPGCRARRASPSTGARPVDLDRLAMGGDFRRPRYRSSGVTSSVEAKPCAVEAVAQDLADELATSGRAKTARGLVHERRSVILP